MRAPFFERRLFRDSFPIVARVYVSYSDETPVCVGSLPKRTAPGFFSGRLTSTCPCSCTVQWVLFPNAVPVLVPGAPSSLQHPCPCLGRPASPCGPRGCCGSSLLCVVFFGLLAFHSVRQIRDLVIFAKRPASVARESFFGACVQLTSMSRLLSVSVAAPHTLRPL